MSIVELPPPAPAHAGDEDAFLAMPLTGTHLVEASAGTGKTFALATLVTRLVVERGLRVGQVLAVTYTEAATQELRERLRQRLALLARVAGGAELPGEDAEVALCRRLVARQQQVEDAGALRRRLQRAARELDAAAVHTIHGFCTRVLADHALETGERFDAAGGIGGDRELREAVAHDLWRALAADATEAEVLAAAWPSPAELARALDALLRAPRLLPAAVDAGPSPAGEVQAAAQRLREAWRVHGVDASRALQAAIADGVLSRTSYRPDTVAALGEAMDGWSRGASTSKPHDKLDLLTPARLLACTNKKAPRPAPASPLFTAAGDFVDALARQDAWRAQRRLALIHRVRDEGARRLAALKRERRLRSYDDLIDGVARALDGPHAAALVAQLRRQHPVALVDEFQDTDARQWSIFRRVFGEEVDAERAPSDGAEPARFLALIGDPKQAIYGFRGGDVHTYLRARQAARRGPPLDRNFRSRPGLLQAIDSLYAGAGETAFGAPGIAFQPVAPGGRRDDTACLRDGRPAPALTLRRLPPRADGRDCTADASRELAARACTQAIHETLALAAEGRLTVDGRDGARAVGPGDIAVLVRKHRDGLRLARLLAQAGIPAVTAAPTSLFETAQAMELLAVFDALLAPADPRRLHAALSTVLLGFDAGRIDALLRDDAARAHELDRALGWRERWLRAGPLALVQDLCAQAAPRLLELVDGERRLSDFIQLGEALQVAAQRVLGPQALVDWLRARIAGADRSDREQQLRLESDARRVQILTVHGSKGLEFPFVFLPFAAIADGGTPPTWCDVDDGEGRVLHVQPDAAARALQQQEAAAEDARLLYVALTRAQHALWICDGPLYQRAKTPIARMLDALRPGDAIVFDERPVAEEPPAPLPAPATAAPPRARRARRVLTRDWSVYSFSALARLGRHGGNVETLLPRGERADAGDDLLAAAAPDAAGAVSRDAAAFDARFAGTRFGDVVHGAFETVDFAAWRGWREGPPPAGEQAALVDAFRAQGLSQADADDGLPLLTSLVGHTLTAAMPEGARLCDLPAAARRAEMEFHFALKDVPVDALLATVQAHGLLAERQGFGTRRALDGLMTGKIDLVYAHAGQFFVLDYKTNRLPDYSPAALERAMHEGEYTLQAAIYTLALHRWLRFRMGEAYDYERCVGGLRYVFCRGVDARRAPSPGIHAQRLPRALVDALDALFAGGPA